MQKTKRLLAMLMALAMILALLPVFASAATTTTIYMKPGVWNQAGAWFQAWRWGGTTADSWVTFTDSDGDGIFEAQIPSDTTGLKILRKAPSHAANTWTSWNDSGDQSYNGSKNCFVVSNWDSYSWSVYTPPVAVPEWNSPVVSGDSVTFNYWSSENLTSVEVYGSMSSDSWATPYPMTKDADGIWSVTVSGLYNGQYQYKFVTNGSNWINDPKNTGAKVGDNNTFTITESIDWNCDVTLHVQANGSWDNAYAYLWTDTALEAWPGFPMTAEEGLSGWYSVTIPDYTQTSMNVIFTNNAGTQTQDLTITDLPDGCIDYWYIPGADNWGKGQMSEKAPDSYTKQEIATCDVTVHFQNTLGWDTVNGYSWTNTWPATYPSEVWPGTPLYPDGLWYTLQLNAVPYVVGDGIYAIFNTPNSEGYLQTVDLQIPCDGQTSVEVWVIPTGEQTEYLSYICEIFYEEPRPIANVGGQDYYTLEEALDNANGQLITLVGDNYTPTTIEADVTIDLAGWKLDEITVADGYTLTLIDSKNDDYTTMGGVAYVKGNVNTLACVDGKNYVTVLVDGQYTAHRYDFSITHITLDAGNDALGFRATLQGDEFVQAAVTGYGFNMGVQLSKEYANTVEAGQFKGEFTLRLKGIMAAGGADMDIFSTAFITLAGQTITTAQESTTMHKTVEAINDLWNIAGFNATQKAAVKALLNAYYSVTQHWNLDKINDSIVDIPIS